MCRIKPREAMADKNGHTTARTERLTRNSFLNEQWQERGGLRSKCPQGLQQEELVQRNDRSHDSFSVLGNLSVQKEGNKEWILRDQLSLVDDHQQAQQ